MKPATTFLQARRHVLGAGVAALAVALLPRARAADYAPGTGLDIAQYTRPGFAAVNAYVLQGPRATAVLDCQRTAVEARQLAALAAAGGRPVDGIFLSHEHPDHIAGLAVVAAAFPTAPIYAAESTRRYIEQSGPGLLAFMRKRFGEAMPDRIPLPTEIVRDGQIITLAGYPWRVHEFGQAEADNMALLHSAEHDVLFAGDLVGDRVTPWLADGHVGAWMKTLARLRSQFDRVGTCLPGHGAAGPARALIDAQRDYLTFFVDQVRRQLGPRGELSAKAIERIRATTVSRFPGFVPVAPSDDLIADNARAVAGELLRRRAG